ncbi:MAG: NTP transferase domain-containing protein [Proteobacteria bacterium]|nr:NTP transferase domain-containing protein [Pseudomonadota bacterium]MBI3498466.1 NTP transferase domain-containing protein [Pseudomonadota bacterium]
MTAVATALIVSTERQAHAGPIFGSLPTALVTVQGRTVIDRILDRLEAFGVESVAVDAGASKESLAAHLSRRTEPRISVIAADAEPISAALAHLGDGPFFVISSDAFWFDGYRPALRRLANAWSDERFDAVMLLHLTPHAVGYAGMGDYLVDPLGVAKRRPEREVVPYAHTGVQLVHPRLFCEPSQHFSMLPRILSAAEEAGRLGGVVHDGLWFQLASAADLEVVEGRFRRGEVQYGPG